MDIKNTLMGAAVSVVALGGAASAATATLSFSGTSSTATIDTSGTGTAGFDLSAETGLVDGDTLTVFNSANVGGLQVSAPSRIWVTYLGSEAGNENAAFELTDGLTQLFNNQTSTFGDVASFMDDDGGFIDFLFRDITDSESIENGNTGSAPTGLSLAFSDISADGRSVIALFGDGAGDQDYDDIAIRISTVPVPAAGLLLLTALGGLSFVKRRKKA